MEKLKSLKDKFNKVITKLHQGFQEIVGDGDMIVPQSKYIPVSDFAIAQGAKYDEPLKDKNIKGHYILDKNLAPNYEERTIDGKSMNVPVVYQEPTGLAPVIEANIYRQFAIKDDVIIYEGKTVAYPQERVDRDLEHKLINLAAKENPQPLEENVYLLDRKNGIRPSVYDMKRGVDYQYYEYKGKVYCFRFDENNPISDDIIQCYKVTPVQAEYTADGKIQCKSVITADVIMDQLKFVNELANSTKYNIHTSGMMMNTRQGAGIDLERK